MTGPTLRRRAVLLLVGLCACSPGDPDKPPGIFVRDEDGSVVAYPAGCDETPALYDSITLNRLDEERGADGRITDLTAVVVWRATADDTSRPIPLPDHLPVFAAPPGMHAASTSPPDLDDRAIYRLVAEGAQGIDGASFVIADLRQISGQFDLAGRRFDDPSSMRAYACSDAFAEAWRDD